MKKIISTTLLAALLAPSLVLAQGYIGGTLGLSDLDGENDIGIKFFGGYRFNQNLAVEGGYTDFGTADDGGVDVSVDGFEVAAVGILPMNPQIDIFGKLGILLWDADFDAGTFGSGSDDGTDLFLGFGASYNISPQLSARATWDFYDFDNGDGWILGGGLTFKF